MSVIPREAQSLVGVADPIVLILLLIGVYGSLIGVVALTAVWRVLSVHRSGRKQSGAMVPRVGAIEPATEGAQR